MTALNRLRAANVEVFSDYIIVNSTYKITREGEFFNLSSGKQLKVSVDGAGYGVIHPGKDIKLVKIHRVIAEYFVENPYGHSLVRHKDGDRSNNSFRNLEWFSKMSEDLTGKKFGRLTVTGFTRNTVESTGARRLLWKCTCVCGKNTLVQGSNLLSGHTKSCGCLSSEVTAKRNFVHGMTREPEYIVWQGIKERCYNPNCKAFAHYGGRGITMDESWVEDFETFYKDMGPRPSTKHTIERKDVNGNYCKDNCVWTDDRSLQAFNQTLRSTNKSGRTGVYEVKPGTFHVKLRNKRIFTTDDFELACFIREEAELTHYGFIKE